MKELAKLHDIHIILCSVLPAFDFSWRPGLQPAEKIVTLNNMIGPSQFFFAKDVPKIYIGAAFHTTDSIAEIFWSRPKNNFDANHRVTFNIIPDGQFHVYQVNLAANRLYRGVISGLRFDPVQFGSHGEYVDLQFISYRNS